MSELPTQGDKHMNEVWAALIGVSIGLFFSTIFLTIFCLFLGSDR